MFRSTTWGFMFIGSIIGAQQAQFYNRELLFGLFSALAILDLIFMCVASWQEIHADEKTQQIVVQSHEWLCPHCLKSGNSVKIAAFNENTFFAMRDTHLFEFHPETQVNLFNT